jgi:hypothetical protein
MLGVSYIQNIRRKKKQFIYDLNIKKKGFLLIKSKKKTTKFLF